MELILSSFTVIFLLITAIINQKIKDSRKKPETVEYIFNERGIHE